LKHTVWCTAVFSFITRAFSCRNASTCSSRATQTQTAVSARSKQRRVGPHCREGLARRAGALKKLATALTAQPPGNATSYTCPTCLVAPRLQLRRLLRSPRFAGPVAVCSLHQVAHKLGRHTRRSQHTQRMGGIRPQCGRTGAQQRDAGEVFCMQRTRSTSGAMSGSSPVGGTA
jgi:hypothetical protein